MVLSPDPCTHLQVQVMGQQQHNMPATAEILAVQRLGGAEILQCSRLGGRPWKAYQVLVEAHLCQILPEDLGVHVHTLLTNVLVPVDFWEHTLPTCGHCNS